MPVIKNLKEPYATVGYSNATYIIDGVADNVQVQAALDAYDTVLLKTGGFTLATTINVASNKTLLGSGFATILTMANGANADMFNNTSTTAGNSNIILSNFKADGNKANQSGTGAFCQITSTGTNRSNNIIIDNIWATNFEQTCLNPKRVTGLLIKDFISENNGTLTLDHSLYMIECLQFEIVNFISRSPAGAHLKCRSSSYGSVTNGYGESSGSRGWSVSGGSDHVQLTNVHALYSTNDGFTTVDEDSTVPRWINFNACHAIAGLTEGFNLDQGDHHKITGSTARSNKLNGITASSVSENVITDNEIWNNDTANTGNSGIYLVNSSYNSINGNICGDDMTSRTANLTASAASGQAVVTVDKTRLFLKGDNITIFEGATTENRIIASIDSDTQLTVTVNLTNSYTSAADIVGIATQDYGINETGTSNYNSIVGNPVSGNTVAQIATVGANTEVGLNPGY